MEVELPESPSPAKKPQVANPSTSTGWEGGNAFSEPQQPPTNYAQQNPMMRQLPPPPQGTMAIPMDRGVPGGLANAFTTPQGSTRPMPPDFGQPSVGPNAFSTPVQQMAVQQMPVNPYAGTAAMAMADRRPTPVVTDLGPSQGGGTPQLLAVLRDSMYPSQREWAAESLAEQRGSQSQPQVVQALLSSAKDDPAATVRAASVRALVQLQVNTVPAVVVLQALKADPDIRVRREAEQALPALTGGQSPAFDAPVRPVSGH